MWSRTRARISELLRHDNPELRDNDELRQRALVPMADVKLYLPVEAGDYADFYSWNEHATNVGTLFRDKSNPLLPNWLHLPIGYHGRTSTVVVSRKKCGGRAASSNRRPAIPNSGRASGWISSSRWARWSANPRDGRDAYRAQAEESIFGFVLVNDWWARDIQQWEYVPLGPFLGKLRDLDVPVGGDAGGAGAFSGGGPGQGPRRCPICSLPARTTST